MLDARTEEKRVTNAKGDSIFDSQAARDSSAALRAGFRVGSAADPTC